MKILVVGSGGREHALCWALSKSPKVSKIYCTPGNGGIASIAECVDIKADDIIPLVDFALAQKIDLTVVGPEVPLAAGIVDLFEEEGLKIFGPSMAAARLEGSKAYAKSFMKRNDIPTARYAAFTDLSAALVALNDFPLPVVVKADGLAAGKGVMICSTKIEAENALKSIMAEKVFKDAGNKVVIEEFLAGEEASILAVADGKDFILLESSQDHKRIFDNDEGPNTGGMGAYSPAPIVTAKLARQIAKDIISPVIAGMAEEESPFKGILYAGVMITKDGPRVLEFNVRFGDPETQAILPRLKTDLLDVILASVEGRLAGMKLEWVDDACVSVVMASGGYPGNYSTGLEIHGLDQVPEGAVVFHAGTKKDGEKVVTSGGRVLGVTAPGKDIAEAIRNAYAAVEKISFDGAQFRKDIGKKALK